MAKTIKNGVNVSLAEQYRRQLGGTNAALNRARQEIRELKAENARLVEIGSKYRARCEELEDLLATMGAGK